MNAQVAGLDPRLQPGAAGEISLSSKNKSKLRRRDPNQKASKLSNVQLDADADVQDQLTQVLTKNAVRVIDLFREWDEDGNGALDKKEVRRAVAALGYDAPRSEVDAFFDSLDADGVGALHVPRLRYLWEDPLRRVDCAYCRDLSHVATPLAEAELSEARWLREEQTGYAVDLSTDGEDGHFMGSTEDYDACILDLGLPEIDGLSVLGMWRKEGRDFPVLVLTARDSWSDKVAGLDAGADEALTQFFFEAETFLRFRDACVKAGIDKPIVPGILPIENWKGASKFARACGTVIPEWVEAAFETAIRDGREDLLATALCTELCSDLLEEGVDSLHFYTLNRPELTRDVCHAIGVTPKVVLENVA